MDVHESIEGGGARGEAPRLGLLEFEKGRRRRIPFALLGAILFHFLVGLSVVRLSGTRLAEEEARAREELARPTPVRVVFYETRPRPPEPPPPETPIRSDRESRARSEIEPIERLQVRQPAAAGESPDARKAAAAAAPPVPPVAAKPAETVAAAEPGERSRPPDGDEVTPTRGDLSPALRSALREERAVEALRAAAGGRFAGAALDSAIREQGFGNRSSGVGETGALEFDAKDFEWGPYARKIYEIVDRNWKSVIPLAARLPGVSGRVKLRFRIQKNGTVVSLELLESSGRAALDQAALASIELSNPLPPLPPEFAREDVGVTFGYYYNLPVD